MQSIKEKKPVSLPVVGVSACLLGQEVRFNGGHARNRYVTDVLDNFCQWLPLCPEMGMGMSAPRETLRLVGDVDSPRLIGTKTGHDYSDQMEDYARKTIAMLQGGKLHGFILKKKSPSCGLERLPIYNDKGAVPNGVGLFAAALKVAFPMLPMEEDGRLFDPNLREQFLRKLFAYKRLCDFVETAKKPAELVAFHSRHKFLLQGHHQGLSRELGRLVANAGREDVQGLFKRYSNLFMKCMHHPYRRRQQAHALRRVAAQIALPKDDFVELQNTIDNYREKRLPLAAPITLIQHHLRKRSFTEAGIPLTLHPYPEAAVGPVL